MSRLMWLLMLVITALACKQEENYKNVRDEVMLFHDVVMKDHVKIVKNQLLLDTLLRNLKSMKQKKHDLDTLKERVEVANIVQRLKHAEDSMNDWMFKFEPDVSGKSNKIAVQYFKDEMLKIAQIDSLYKKEIKLSEAYLSKFKNH